MTQNFDPTLARTALAFRGYNTTNLGRTPELLEHADYGPVLAEYLREASDVCAQTIERPVDLIRRVEDRSEPSLEEYAESIALIVAVEQAQLAILHRCFEIDYHQAEVQTGFSLGEISALVAGGVYAMRDALKIPLTMAADCVKLSHDVVMGIVFSRGDTIPMDEIRRICIEINLAGQGVIGVSTILSPNSFLVLGTQDTVARFRKTIKKVTSIKIHLRLNDHRWPPLHTPIVWAANVSNRAAHLLHTLPGGLQPPKPDILSFVTGKRSYTALNSRELISQWIDHPQRLWDVVNELLFSGIETILHLGPQPNIIPATFDRLAANVEAQTRGSRRMRAASVVARRSWLQSLLPRRAALLRAPLMKHIILEDWLLEQNRK